MNFPHQHIEQENTKFLIIDVGYYDNLAKVVSVIICKEKEEIFTKTVTSIEPYIPGMFYKKELPCILSLINDLPENSFDIIIIDGYVYLGEKKPGLGVYLYNALSEKFPIIGLAKRYFRGSESVTQKITRGESKNPLYVSSIGISIVEASKIISQMSGKYRIPDAIKKADTLTKEIN